ncbi:cellulose-binding protein [Streptomyces sp. NBC_01754]|uniref:cellulose-binding protein n=1 Tax=Streptomyces sp. NBC_01754 TaxID=2975930 RepID=UPI002DDA80DD|nr:cellulose-binding protein [Streptomyces sp. NBC_01754]WSC92903.1 cellulose-binding protein [Streptomyces sp. NBC_01754]
MSGGPVSAYDFVGVRGRGYRPEQVDRVVAGLSGERDEALERLARLTVLAEELAAESARLREVVASLAPQTYASLGERAQRILALATAEAEAARGAAAEEAQALWDAADAAGREAEEAARAGARSERVAADEAAEALLGAARETAGTLVREALEDAGRVREEAESEMAETRRRTADVLAHQEQEHTERGKAADEEFAAAEAVVAAREAELAGRGEELLARARRELSEAEEAARHGQEDAEARAAGLLSEARVAEERVGRETDRVLREHEEAGEEVRAHMAHVRTALAALTGRALVGREPAGD